MARCPFCRCSVNTLFLKCRNLYEVGIEKGKLKRVSKYTRGIIEGFLCPECERFLLRSWIDAEKFLKGEIVLAKKNECARKKAFAVYGGKVYHVLREEESIFVLQQVENDTVAAIVKASF